MQEAQRTRMGRCKVIARGESDQGIHDIRAVARLMRLGADVYRANEADEGADEAPSASQEHGNDEGGCGKLHEHGDFLI